MDRKISRSPLRPLFVLLLSVAAIAAIWWFGIHSKPEPVNTSGPSTELTAAPDQPGVPVDLPQTKMRVAPVEKVSPSPAATATNEAR